MACGESAERLHCTWHGIDAVLTVCGTCSGTMGVVSGHKQRQTNEQPAAAQLDTKATYPTATEIKKLRLAVNSQLPSDFNYCATAVQYMDNTRDGASSVWGENITDIRFIPKDGCVGLMVVPNMTHAQGFHKMGDMSPGQQAIFEWFTTKLRQPEGSMCLATIPCESKDDVDMSPCITTQAMLVLPGVVSAVQFCIDLYVYQGSKTLYLIFVGELCVNHFVLTGASRSARVGIECTDGPHYIATEQLKQKNGTHVNSLRIIATDQPLQLKNTIRFVGIPLRPRRDYVFFDAAEQLAVDLVRDNAALARDLCAKYHIFISDSTGETLDDFKAVESNATFLRRLTIPETLEKKRVFAVRGVQLCDLVHARSLADVTGSCQDMIRYTAYVKECNRIIETNTDRDIRVSMIANLGPAPPLPEYPPGIDYITIHPIDYAPPLPRWSYRDGGGTSDDDSGDDGPCRGAKFTPLFLDDGSSRDDTKFPPLPSHGGGVLFLDAASGSTASHALKAAQFKVGQIFERNDLTDYHSPDLIDFYVDRALPIAFTQFNVFCTPMLDTVGTASAICNQIRAIVPTTSDDCTTLFELSQALAGRS